jgi:hypothetical protein
LELLSHLHFASIKGMHHWREAICSFHVLALEELVAREAQDGKVRWEN